MTTRQISETIEDIYGFEVSEGMVSDITDKRLPRIENGKIVLYLQYILSFSLMRYISLSVMME